MRLATIAALASAVALACCSASAVASGPGVDEYTLNIPGAGGGSPLGGNPPAARLGMLPPAVRTQLSGPQGSLLALVATSPELGAPENQRRSSGAPGAKPPDLRGGSQGFPAAALRAAGDGSSLLLLGALAAIALLAVASMMRRRASLTGAG
jgi:hypothetical protein